MTNAENESLPKSSEIEVDETVYPLEVGKTAAYLFTDRARVELFRKDESPKSYFIRLTPKDAKTDAETLATDYANELLNTSLKETFTDRFAEMREDIIVTAITNSLRAAMVTESETAPKAEERSIDDVLKDLAKEFDLGKSQDKIDNL